MKAEKPVEVSRNRILSVYLIGISCRYYLAGIFFHLTASYHFHNVLISNILPKSPLRLGTLESTQKQGLFLQLIDYQALQKQSDGYGVENTGGT